MVGQAKQANEQEACKDDKINPVFRQPGPAEQASAQNENDECGEQQQIVPLPGGHLAECATGERRGRSLFPRAVAAGSRA